MISLAALRVLAAAVVSFSPTPSPTPSALPQIAHVVTADRSDETLRNSVRTTYVVTAADIASNRKSFLTKYVIARAMAR